MESLSSSEELRSVAWDVARRFVEFGSYGSKIKACRALKRRCKGFTDEEYLVAFEESVALLKTAMEIVANNAELLWQQWQAQQGERKQIEFQGIDEELHQQHPQFSLSLCQLTLNWVFFWHHLK
ncbi:MAG TPA: hypothetical protein VGB77_01595 [Abditibacteriaceae bacterium]|jgi:hypothetical protein